MIYFTVIQLWIFCFGIAVTLPFSISSGRETHKFRWTTSSDLNYTLCAYGVDLAWYYNLTIKNDDVENYITGVKFSSFASPEVRREYCAHNASLFMLVGNPGIIWHPETGQCVKTKVQTQPISGIWPDVVYVTSKYLTTGYECEHDDPDVALFKFNKDRPQRLSFIANIDPKTGKQEEWCIREWAASKLEVVPDCKANNPFTTYQMTEMYFLEIV